MNDYLSGRRMGNFLLKDLVEGYRPLLIAAGAVAGVLLLNYVINALSSQGATEMVRIGSTNSVTQMTYFGLTLFLGGFIISSRAFSELHVKNRNHDWLMIPASPIEKYLSRLALTTVGVGIGTVVFFFVFSILGAALTALLFGRPQPVFSPFDGRVWMLVLHYFVLQSIFFAAAVYFKKAQFIKTVLVVTAFAVGLMLLAAGALRLVFWKEFPYLASENAFANFDFSVIAPRLQAAARTASVVATVFYWAVLAPVLWAFAYFRLCEAEARNGV